MCVAVFPEERGLLVDPSYRWFGVRHREFRILDDLEVVGVQLCHPTEGVPRVDSCRAGLKLCGDIPWAHLSLARALIGKKRSVWPIPFSVRGEFPT